MRLSEASALRSSFPIRYRNIFYSLIHDYTNRRFVLLHPFINLLLHQLAPSPTCPFTNLLFHQLALSTTCSFTNLLLHQLALSSTCSFTNLLLYQPALVVSTRISAMRDEANSRRWSVPYNGGGIVERGAVEGIHSANRGIIEGIILYKSRLSVVIG